MAEIKLTNVDTIVSQGNKTLSIESAADLTNSLKTNIINAADNQVLAYDSTSGKWINQKSFVTETQSDGSVDFIFTPNP